MKKLPKLRMKYAGGVVKHLGLSMYHGAVPAIAEFIANAWDADAKTVNIKMPFDTADFSTAQIIIEDTGTGMSYLDCDSKFLIVGRDRVIIEGEKSPGGRRVMAHKGLGKLAGFGIANTVTVETCKNGKVTSFTMKYAGIEKLQQGQTYYPEQVKVSTDARRKNGTRIVLSDLRLRRRLDEDEFMRSMGRKFSVITPEFDFKVLVNDKILERHLGPYEYFYPTKEILENGEKIDEKGFGVTTIPQAGEIRWWIAFTKEPIKYPEMRKISIITHGKMANNPFDFDFARGTTGQLGLEYMTGEVHADFVDTAEYDGVATGRNSLIWDRPESEALRDWGRKIVSRVLEDWADKRAQARIDQLEAPRREANLPSFQERIQNYPATERKEVERAIRSLARIPTITPERFEENVDTLLNAVEDRNLRGLITQISEADPESQAMFYDLLREFNVLEAIRVAKVVDGHLMIIQKFRNLIETKAKEKPEMQEHLNNYPWLIDVNMIDVHHEKQLRTIVKQILKEKMERSESDLRVDFLWLGDAGRAFIVEVKRPGLTATRQEVEQLELYVDTLQTEFRKITDPKLKRTVCGYIVAGGFDVDQSKLDRLFNSGIMTRTWDALLTGSENSHRDFLNIVRTRAPKDDPRIKELAYQATASKQD